MKRIYISGPMSNIPEFNFPAFYSEAKYLRDQGCDVVNPAEMDIGDPSTLIWHECLRRDIIELMSCDSIWMLPGWSESKGAQLEHHIACELGMDIIYPRNWL